MNKYQSHKIVEAAVIVACASKYVGIAVEGGQVENVSIPPDFYGRGEPSPGDYLVRYQPDGYLSWSPKAVFEAGYREMSDGGDYRDRVRQERAELYEKLEKLERYITTNTSAGRLLIHQAAIMREYVGILDARIAEFPDGPVAQAADLIVDGSAARGERAAVEVTVTAPAGKRASVSIGRPGGSTSWTVTEGQSQTWSVIGDEALVVCVGEPHSTVAHKRDAS